MTFIPKFIKIKYINKAEKAIIIEEWGVKLCIWKITNVGQKQT